MVIFLLNRCTKNHIFIIQMFWKDGFSKNIAREFMIFLIWNCLWLCPILFQVFFDVTIKAYILQWFGFLSLWNSFLSLHFLLLLTNFVYLKLLAFIKWTNSLIKRTAFCSDVTNFNKSSTKKGSQYSLYCRYTIIFWNVSCYSFDNKVCTTWRVCCSEDVY